MNPGSLLKYIVDPSDVLLLSPRCWALLSPNPQPPFSQDIAKSLSNVVSREELHAIWQDQQVEAGYLSMPYLSQVGFFQPAGPGPGLKSRFTCSDSRLSVLLTAFAKILAGEDDSCQVSASVWGSPTGVSLPNDQRVSS